MSDRMPVRFPYDLSDTEEVTARIQQAVNLALLDHKRKGNPIVGRENGELVWTQAEDIVVPDEEEINGTTR